MLLILEGHSFSLPQLVLQLIVQHHPIDEATHHGEEQERLQDPLLFSGTHPVSHSPYLGGGEAKSMSNLGLQQPQHHNMKQGRDLRDEEVLAGLLP